MLRRTAAARFQTQYVVTEAGNQAGTMAQAKAGNSQVNALLGGLVVISGIAFVAGIPNTARTSAMEWGGPYLIAAPMIGHGTTMWNKLSANPQQW